MASISEDIPSRDLDGICITVNNETTVSISYNIESTGAPSAIVSKPPRCTIAAPDHNSFIVPD